MKKYLLLAAILLSKLNPAGAQQLFSYLAEFKDVAWYGFADSAGNTKSGARYNLIMQPAEGICRVWSGQTKSSDYSNISYGFCLPNGTEIVEPKYRKAENFSEGLAAVSNGDVFKGFKYGYVNRLGAEQIPLIYKDARSFSQGLAPVKVDDDKWQYIDKNGTVKIAGPFLEADPFSEGLAGVSVPYDLGSGVMSFHKGFIDLNGKMVIQPAYNYVTPFKNGLAVASVSESSPSYRSYKVLIDKTGRRITKQEFISIDNYRRDGLYAVKISGKDGLGDEKDVWGVVDQQGVLQAARFKYEPAFNEGLALFNQDKLYGFMDKNGTVVVKPAYKNAYGFSGGLAAVRFVDSDQWGYINKKGEVVIKPAYVSAAGFSDGLAVVKTGKNEFDADNLTGAINAAGKTVIPFEKRVLGNFENGRAVAEKNYISYYQYAKGSTSLACEPAILANGRYAILALSKNDIQGALNILNKESAKNCPLTDYWLGYILMQVEGPLKDTVKGATLIEQSAKKGYPEAMYSLGYMYQTGMGGKKDDKLAMQWLIKAGNAGVPTAYTLLGGMVENTDAAKAAAYYLKGAELCEPIAMYDLALLYRDGKGVTKSTVDYKKWLTLSSQHQYEPASKLLYSKEK